MNKAVQQAVQQRDEAVQEQPVMIPWAPRADGKRAYQVSERATVFDRPASAVVTPVDPVEGIADPIWDHRGGSKWTPDLVHCRLVVVGEIVRRMPPVLRGGYVSQLGSLAISEMSVARRIPPSPAEISMADWTLTEIMARRHRQQMLLAAAFGLSFEKIAEALRSIGQSGSKTTVQRWYLDERRILAGHWQARRAETQAKIDGLTFDRWEGLFEKRQK